MFRRCNQYLKLEVAFVFERLEYRKFTQISNVVDLFLVFRFCCLFVLENYWKFVINACGVLKKAESVREPIVLDHCSLQGVTLELGVKVSVYCSAHALQNEQVNVVDFDEFGQRDVYSG